MIHILKYLFYVIERLVIGDKSIEDVEDSAIKIPASLHRMNSSNDVIKYWKHDMSCMKMVCDYKVHREALSTGMNLLHGKYFQKF